ncbi:Small ribosomal subunit protein uS10c-like protein [Drosera capensis]
MATTSLSSTILASLASLALFTPSITTKPEIPFLNFTTSIQNPKPLKTFSPTRRIRAVPEALSDYGEATIEETIEESFDEESVEESESFDEVSGNGEEMREGLTDFEVLEVSSENPATSKLSILAEYEKLFPKLKIRIKLWSYYVPLLEDSCKQIMDAAWATNARTMGPVPLPTKKKIYCVLKSPHVDKDARFHFEIRTHSRLIDIYPTAETIDSLLLVDIPLGVEIRIEM